MDVTTEDAYAILGVAETATQSEIRKAYFQLAREHHPDKGGDRHVFSKIGNAYELLGDPEKRREYDQARKYKDNSASSSSRRGPPHFSQEDIFAHFHDPFEIFERVFQQEFGGGGWEQQQQRRDLPGGSQRRHQQARHNPFQHDFFSGGPSLFGGMGHPMMSGTSLFQRDPFFGGGGMMMNNGMGSMMNEMMMMNGGNTATTTSTSMSFSSSMGTGRGGPSVSTSTSTRIVNGRRETITEKVIRHADGRVERHVEQSDTSGINNRQALPSTDGSHSSMNSRKLLSGNTRPRSTSGGNRGKPVIDLTDEEHSSSRSFTTVAPAPHNPLQHRDKKTKRSRALKNIFTKKV